MLDNLVRQVEEKIELAEKRNFESVYLTLKPKEAKELLEVLKEYRE